MCFPTKQITIMCFPTKQMIFSMGIFMSLERKVFGVFLKKKMMIYDLWVPIYTYIMRLV